MCFPVTSWMLHLKGKRNGYPSYFFRAWLYWSKCGSGLPSDDSLSLLVSSVSLFEEPVIVIIVSTLFWVCISSSTVALFRPSSSNSVCDFLYLGVFKICLESGNSSFFLTISFAGKPIWTVRGEFLIFSSLPFDQSHDLVSTISFGWSLFIPRSYLPFNLYADANIASTS